MFISVVMTKSTHQGVPGAVLVKGKVMHLKVAGLLNKLIKTAT